LVHRIALQEKKKWEKKKAECLIEQHDKNEKRNCVDYQDIVKR
jgi:hypothetical protein